MSHAYHPMCGCADCDRVEEADEYREEHIESLLSDSKWVESNIREAETWTAGSFDGDHYTEVALAFHALHHCDTSTLPGSALLERVLRLAKVEGEALDAQLRQMAETEVDGRRAAA